MAERKDRSHAVIPAYMGGKLVPDNTMELPLPLHALHHLLIAESMPVGSKDRAANLWAFDAISRRENYEEKMATATLVALHHRTK